MTKGEAIAVGVGIVAMGVGAVFYYRYRHRVQTIESSADALRVVPMPTQLKKQAEDQLRQKFPCNPLQGCPTITVH